MHSYIYSGKQKTYPQPKKNKIKPIFKNIGFILVASHPVGGFKVNGSPLLANFNGSQILEYQLDVINSVCENPEILISTGIDHNDFVKHERKEEYSIIENTLYEFSNSSEDLRLCLNALRSPHVVFIDTAFIPTIDTFKYLLSKKNQYSKIFIKNNKYKDYVGVTLEKGLIKDFSFNVENSLTGMYYINTNDIYRIRKRNTTKVFNKNKFTFELFTDIKTKAILDESTSILIHH